MIVSVNGILLYVRWKTLTQIRQTVELAVALRIEEAQPAIASGLPSLDSSSSMLQIRCHYYLMRGIKWFRVPLTGASQRDTCARLKVHNELSNEAELVKKQTWSTPVAKRHTL
jgi:hypothetical protein